MSSSPDGSGGGRRASILSLFRRGSTSHENGGAGEVEFNPVDLGNGSRRKATADDENGSNC